jgi:hypothetical protein
MIQALLWSDDTCSIRAVMSDRFLTVFFPLVPTTGA